VNATDAEVRDFQQKLRDSKRRNSQDLQKNVFVNRTQFVLISKEIDKLKTEMRVLRGLLNELQVTTNSLKLEDTSGPGNLSSTSDTFSAANRKRANRSSIADLTALHMSNLQLLWKEVEGSQKFLPAIPGRHIIIESRNWVELNAATWKARRTVQMVLLNDHLLLAVLKKKRADPSANARPRDDLPDLKLVAERCWPLSEIEMVDLSPTASEHESASRRGREAVSNAINVRVGKESFVYRNDEADVKVKLLLAFKKTKEDLRKAMRADAVDKHRLKDSLTYFTSRDPALLEQGELLQTLSNNLKDQPNLILHVDGKPRNLRWVEDQMDELDESIAHRDFDEAVRNIEKLRGVAKNLKGNLLAAELINLKLDERSSRLAGIITEDLMENPNQKNRVRRFVGWLTRLDFEDRAREAYLEARSAVIKKRTR
jgi:exocyst complex component 8